MKSREKALKVKMNEQNDSVLKAEAYKLQTQKEMEERNKLNRLHIRSKSL
jgi:hypothetical protein